MRQENIYGSTGDVEPKVYFRIAHIARDGYHGIPVAAYSEQKAKIALGPKGAFESGNIGPDTPGGRTLRKGMKWQSLLESGVAADPEASTLAATRRGKRFRGASRPRAAWWRANSSLTLTTMPDGSLTPRSEAGRGSRLVWITDLLPNELAGSIGNLVEQPGDIIIKTLERGTSSGRAG